MAFKQVMQMLDTNYVFIGGGIINWKAHQTLRIPGLARPPPTSMSSGSATRTRTRTRASTAMPLYYFVSRACPFHLEGCPAWYG
eukprot:scaffold487319_cov34-Prasinocladus_malaysianus.AAC.1